MKKMRLDLNNLKVEGFDAGEYMILGRLENARSDMIGGCSGQDCPTDGTVEAHAREETLSGCCYNRTNGCKHNDTRYEGDSCHGSCYPSDGHIC